MKFRFKTDIERFIAEYEGTEVAAGIWSDNPVWIRVLNGHYVVNDNDEGIIGVSFDRLVNYIWKNRKTFNEYEWFIKHIR